MGAQQGEALRDLEGWRELAEFYPSMATRLLTMGLAPRLRRGLTPVLQHLMTRAARRMSRARSAQFPEYVERTEALLAGAGLSPEICKWWSVMDVFQNTVSTVARYDILKASGVQMTAIPACSSLAVWGDASSDGQLRHARNFDFPGVGVWDQSPAVVLCDPDEGLRYGFVTARVVDAPVTAFNEAGLTVSSNTRFHRDVSYGGASAADIGHEIVRRARTLEEAVSIARGVGSASTWGFLVSSAQERDAVMIEMSASEVHTHRPGEGEAFLPCTNRYKSAALQAGELTTSTAFAVDSDAREERLRQAVVGAGERGLGREDLERLLGDLEDLEARDGDVKATRLAGNCIMSPLTVQSVVSEPEQGSIRVSVGSAPTGLGPYVSVPWEWDGEVGVVSEVKSNTPRGPRRACGTPLEPAELAAIEAYVEAGRRHFASVQSSGTREAMECAVQHAPREPHFRFLAAMLAIVESDFSAACEHLDRALEVEHGVYRRALVLLWASRVRTVISRPDAADARAELLALRHPSIGHLHEAAAKETRRPKSGRALAGMVPDLILISC
ncbi:MAG: hypothetical protein ACJAYU_000473 [Bradymonadia bacterium]|jgi:hypothetical protein